VLANILQSRDMGSARGWSLVKKNCQILLAKGHTFTCVLQTNRVVVEQCEYFSSLSDLFGAIDSCCCHKSFYF
jgi:hypothetical protein